MSSEGQLCLWVCGTCQNISCIIHNTLLFPRKLAVEWLTEVFPIGCFQTVQRKVCAQKVLIAKDLRKSLLKCHINRSAPTTTKEHNQMNAGSLERDMDAAADKRKTKCGINCV